MQESKKNSQRVVDDLEGNFVGDEGTISPQVRTKYQGTAKDSKI